MNCRFWCLNFCCRCLFFGLVTCWFKAAVFLFPNLHRPPRFVSSQNETLLLAMQDVSEDTDVGELCGLFQQSTINKKPIKLMIRPLDRVQINSFFKHLPKRRHFAKFCNRLFYMANRIIYLFFCSKPAEAKTEAAMGQIVA